jgi:DNA-binding CsgD family transcriptional regulator
VSQIEAGTIGLLEREEELTRIGSALSRAAEGAGGFVVVEGTAGLGKTSLLLWARTRMAQLGGRVLTAQGHEREHELPFGLALQLFERELAEGDEEALLRGAAGRARSLFGLADSPTAPGDTMSIVHGLYWLAANLAQDEPLLLCADDAQWGDRASIQLLLYLAQRVEDLPICLLVAHRPIEAGSADLIEQLDTHPAARPVRLQGLSPEGCARLIRSHPALAGADDALCATCAEITAGNPFLLSQLVAQIAAADGELPAADEIAELTPPEVLRRTLARIAAGPEGSLELVRAVSVLDEDSTAGRAAELAGLTTETAMRAAEALAAEDILDADLLHFVHPMLQSAIYSGIPSFRREEAHRRAAELLERSGEPAERIAVHLLATQPGADPHVADVLRAAAAQAARVGAPDVAAACLERALREQPEGEGAGLLIELGHARAAAGLPGAEEALERAAAASDGDLDRASALLALGQVQIARGDAAAAAASLRSGLDLTDPRSDLGKRLLAGLVAGTQVGVVEREEIAPFRHLAPDTPEGATLADLTLAAAFAVEECFRVGSAERAAELATTALSDRRLLQPEARDLSSWTFASAAATWSDRLDLAIEASTAALREASGRGSVHAFATASYCRATPSFWAGRLAEAAADAEQATKAWESGWRMYVGPAYAVLVWAQVELAELEDATASLAAFERTRAPMPPQFVAYVEHARGRLAEGEHRWGDAAAHHLRAGEMLATDNPGVLPWRSSAAVALARTGETEGAARLAEEELDLARRFGAPRSIGVALSALGPVRGGDEGLRLTEEAVAVLADSPARLERCRAMVRLGSLRRRMGHPKAALEDLLAARDLASRLGAVALLERANEEIRIAGGKPRRISRTGVESLTPAELRVARMAARGMTNREIAEALFVTVKAVEWHLRNAYRRLEIQRRGDLARFPELAEDALPTA